MTASESRFDGRPATSRYVTLFRSLAGDFNLVRRRRPLRFMNESNQYASVRDYLGLIRRQRWIVLVVPIVFAAAAFALSTIQRERYEASASVEFRDLSQDFRLLDVNVVPAAAPNQRAATSAESATSEEVARRVRKDLGEDFSVDELQAGVTARVGTQTNLVVVEASGQDPQYVADLANAFAERASQIDTRNQLRQVDILIEQLRRQSPKNPIQLDKPVENLQEVVAQQRLIALLSLRRIADPAEVVRTAEVPTTPVSPKPARNAVLAGLVGFALALLFAFLRDSLDRRIRTINQAHELIDLPVLGRVGTTAFGGAGLIGADGGASPADLEAFQMLRTNLAFFQPDKPVRTVLVTSGLPEEGKTTVAASLAAAAAAAGMSTLLVDADLRRPMVAARLGLQPAPGLAEYLLGSVPPKEILQVKAFELAQTASRAATSAPVAAGRTGTSKSPPSKEKADAMSNGSPSEGTSSLVCITAGKPPARPAELLASPRSREFLDRIGRAYDLVVIDSSPLLASADPLELIPHIDAVLVCVRVSKSTRDEVQAVKEALGRLPDRPAGLVVTGLGEGDGEYGYYGYSYGA